MPSFAVSISVLGLIQGALVALPGRLPPLPWGLGDLSSRWWALVPAGLDRRRDRGRQLLRGLGDLSHLPGAGRRAAAGRALARTAGPGSPARLDACRGAALRARLGGSGARSPARRPRPRCQGWPASRSAGCWSRWCRLSGCASASTRWPRSTPGSSPPTCCRDQTRSSASPPRPPTCRACRRSPSARPGWASATSSSRRWSAASSQPPPIGRKRRDGGVFGPPAGVRGRPGRGAGAGVRPALLRRRLAAGDGSGRGGARHRAAALGQGPANRLIAAATASGRSSGVKLKESSIVTSSASASAAA